MGARKAKQEKKIEDATKKAEKAKEKKPEKKIKVIEGVRGVVRLAEMNLDGTRRVRNAVLGIKGIGKSLANSIVMISGIDPNVLLGSLTDEQIQKLEDAIKNPSKYGVPYHMLNRRLDPSTGENRHLVSSELSFTVRGDIDFMKKIRCYKGIRHELGLPVRGQRTKSSFRTGMIVGVTKAKLKPGAAPAATGAPSPTAAGAKPGAPPVAGKPAAPTAPVAGAKPGAPVPTKAPAKPKEEKK
jgi:small subunit ribosomal protein S13